MAMVGFGVGVVGMKRRFGICGSLRAAAGDQRCCDTADILNTRSQVEIMVDTKAIGLFA